MAQRPSVKGVADIVALIDGLQRVTGRSRITWYLAFGGLFLDAYANAALSAGLGPMTDQMDLSSTQISVLTATAPFLAIIFNPVGGWLASRIGRVPPLLLAKLLAVAGALLATFAGDFTTVWFGRVLVGMAYGVDFAVAMALLAEYTPKASSGRLNLWQAVWYCATTGNLLLALGFYQLDVGQDIWRWSLGSAGVIAALLLVLQYVFLVESPAWLASRGRLEEAVRNLRRIYGIDAVADPAAAGAAGAAGPAEGAAPSVGLRDAGLLFKGAYLPRTLLSSAISLGQALQYFAVGWYLPVISLTIFGESFEKATLGSMVFNAVGIAGGLASAYCGRRMGLRMSSAWGFGGVFVALVLMGLTFGRAPLVVAFCLPVLFILCHSAGPGANGKSIAALSYSSDVRALGTGVTGMIGSLGSVIGLYVFPQIKDRLGMGDTFLVLSVVPLLGMATCLAIKWDPTRAEETPHEPAAGEAPAAALPGEKARSV
ncbi:MFS transporter [Streptomyces boncukensis]|uniref:Sugar porter family MFS transporter n=1 Tax=Streptomyces boncukensis TaxID=2711219 RepID=A0A6G4WYV8_9ACTN|nr:MFS transporter [Streptomyces boncukensis]NGO69704.1 sugar porter family MFS transporter [Streptomyces boncukensis]